MGEDAPILGELEDVCLHLPSTLSLDLLHHPITSTHTKK